MEMLERGKAEGIETRGISDHGFINSVYFRDPDGYVVELTAKTAEEHELLDRERQGDARCGGRRRRLRAPEVGK